MTGMDGFHQEAGCARPYASRSTAFALFETRNTVYVLMGEGARNDRVSEDNIRFMLIAGAIKRPCLIQMRDVPPCSMQDQAKPRWNVRGWPGSLSHAVSRSATHWYHVSLKRRHEDRYVGYEEMLNDRPRLVELLISQDESLVVQDVQVVTPSWMNKGASWKMEKLTLFIGFNQAEVPICILEVESGEKYIDTHPARPQC